MFTFLEWHPKRKKKNPLLYHMMQKKKVYSSNPARPTGLIFLVDNNNPFQICHNYRELSVYSLIQD